MTDKNDSKPIQSLNFNSNWKTESKGRKWQGYGSEWFDDCFHKRFPKKYLN